MLVTSVVRNFLSHAAMLDFEGVLEKYKTARAENVIFS